MDAHAPNRNLTANHPRDCDHDHDQKPRSLSGEEAKRAAVLIQKTFRGHRTRRQLKGFGLDASTRWYEVGLVRANKCKKC